MPRSLSILALIAANLVPLIGVLFFGWNASLVLALFWIENLIIGAFNVTKMIIASVYHKRYGELPLSAFFILHFGLFCSAHGMLLWDLLGYDSIDAAGFFSNPAFGPFSIFFEGAAVLLSFIKVHGSLILLGAGALVLSHLVSFIENFILRGELFEAKANNLMGKPYKQILIMHAGLILGAFAIDKFGSTLWLLLVIVAFKIVVDTKLHLGRRKDSNETLIMAD